MAKKVLVVDDDPASLRLVESLLTTNGYEVATAADGDEVEAKVSESRPDLIIMDLLMPEVGGTDAVKALQSRGDAQDIPVIFLTSVNAQDDHTGEKFDIQVENTTYKTLIKPFEAEDLLTEVASLTH